MLLVRPVDCARTHRTHVAQSGTRFGRQSEANRHLEDQKPCEKWYALQIPFIPLLSSLTLYSGESRRKQRGTRTCNRCFNEVTNTSKRLPDVQQSPSQRQQMAPRVVRDQSPVAPQRERDRKQPFRMSIESLLVQRPSQVQLKVSSERSTLKS